MYKSLHTEYSYGKRKWDSALVQEYLELVVAQKDSVPQLWKNERWAEQFADFIFELNGSGSVPKVIEIHPPFSDYTDIDALCEAIEKAGVQLKVAYDLPQIYTAHNAKIKDEFIRLLEETKQFCSFIGGVIYGAKAYPQLDGRYLTAGT